MILLDELRDAGVLKITGYPTGWWDMEWQEIDAVFATDGRGAISVQGKRFDECVRTLHTMVMGYLAQKRAA